MNKKKTLLFVCYGLGIGGIEKCLVNLLNALPEERYEIDLLLMNPEYDMLDQIRRKINLLDSFDYIYNTESTMQDMKSHGGIWKNRAKLLPYVDHRVRIKLGLPLWTTFQPVEKQYDVAIAYSQNGLAPYYVIDKTNAQRKVLWYHNGAYERDEKYYALDKTYYSKFDYIVTVSNDCKKMLMGYFHNLADKIVVLRNFCDTEDIVKKSKMFCPNTFSKGKMQIVTVGRMTKEKGADLALESCKILLQKGLDICWHWVGDGQEAKSIGKRRDAMGLKDNFLLEGNQQNPYPYMAQADIYVQPSYYEAYSTTVTEAKVLQKPIIVTDVGGMRDQLTDGVNGRIVPIDSVAIAQAVEQLIIDKEAVAFIMELEKESYQQETVLKEYERTVFC